MKIMLCKAFFALLFCFDLSAQSGKVDPKAVKIDASLNQFVNGYAIVGEKYQRMGIIDRNGNFVVPLGTYQLISSLYGKFFRVAKIDGSRSMHGFVTTSGELVIPCNYTNATDFSADGFAYVEKKVNQEYKSFIIDATGRETPYAGKYIPNHAPAPFYIDYDGIVDKSGKQVASGQFLYAQQFSEGLALTAQIVDLIAKFGFVDKSGKAVIPYQYTIVPSSFHNGLAVVIPKDRSEFEYGYIDKTGKLVLKIIQQKGDYSVLTPNPDISNTDQYAFHDKEFALSPIERKGSSCYIDRLGNVHCINDLIGKFEPKFKEGKITIEGIDKDGFHIRTSNGSGLIDRSGKIIVPPIFQSAFFFDEESGLAKAAIYSNGKNIVGYIDRGGVFVIIYEKNSKW